MNNKLDLVRKIRESLESLYSLYDGNIGGGDLIIVDELDGILYKGKNITAIKFILLVFLEPTYQ